MESQLCLEFCLQKSTKLGLKFCCGATKIHDLSLRQIGLQEFMSFTRRKKNQNLLMYVNRKDAQLLEDIKSLLDQIKTLILIYF